MYDDEWDVYTYVFLPVEANYVLRFRLAWAKMREIWKWAPNNWYFGNITERPNVGNKVLPNIEKVLLKLITARLFTKIYVHIEE